MPDIMNHLFLILGVSALLIACTAVAAQFPDGHLEPGQADRGAAPQPVSEPTPLEWTHPAVETRGVWMTWRDMTAPKDEVLRRLDELAAANFNRVLVNIWFRGYAGYPGSCIVPQFPPMRGEDRVGFIIDQSRKRGLGTELWMEYGFYAYYTPDAAGDPSMGPLLDAHPELAAINADGQKHLHNPQWGDYYSLCPSNPRSHELLAQLAVEALQRYPAAGGLNLDRIRYPQADWCYCPYCREHFQQQTGIALRTVSPGSPQAETLLQWKRERTADAVAYIRAAVHEHRPGLPITAYVVGPHLMESRAQGWDLWMQRGLLDGIAVSMYEADIAPVLARATELLGGDTSRLICAISAEHPPEVYLRNVEIARTGGSMGQFTWYLGALSDAVEPLKQGPYRLPAACPLPSADIGEPDH